MGLTFFAVKLLAALAPVLALPFAFWAAAGPTRRTARPQAAIEARMMFLMLLLSNLPGAQV